MATKTTKLKQNANQKRIITEAMMQQKYVNFVHSNKRYSIPYVLNDRFIVETIFDQGGFGSVFEA